MRRLILIIFCLSNSGGLHSQWERLQNLPADTFITVLGPITSLEYRDIYFLNQDTGFVAGGFWLRHASDGAVYQTTDGGFSWSTIYQPGNGCCPMVCGFKDISNGYVHSMHAGRGSYEILEMISNYRGSWVKVGDLDIEAIHEIFFMDEAVGYIVGYTQVLKTMDGGENWKVLWNMDSIRNITSCNEDFRLIFINDRLSWVIGEGDCFAKHTSEDGWQNIKDDPRSRFPMGDLYFVDNDYGWYMGGYCGEGEFISILLRTEDGGQNWIDITSDQYIIRKMHFINRSFGWAIGTNTSDQGVVLETSDGGDTWRECYVNEFGSLNNIRFRDSTGWIVGQSVILKLSNIPSTTSSIIGNANICQIFQNQPNPFRSSTLIPYKIARTTQIELSIYNLLGCKVATLVYGIQGPGNYQIRWNAEKCNPGIYLCELKSAQINQVIKLSLME